MRCSCCNCVLDFEDLLVEEGTPMSSVLCQVCLTAADVLEKEDITYEQN